MSQAIYLTNQRVFTAPKILVSQSQLMGMGGFFDDLFDDAWGAITGLNDALSGVLTSIVNTVKQIGETIALVVRAAIGDVRWSEVFSSLGEIFQEIANIGVLLNPDRFLHDWLSESKITSHAFSELDKFTGGMLTSATNVSDLVYRAARGDAIPKEELIRDALFGIQVASIIFTGPTGLGIMVGQMVGREVCAKQTEGQAACMAAFSIVGAATGSWGAQTMGVNWGSAYWDQVKQSGMGPIEQAYSLSEAQAQASFTQSLQTAGQQYLISRGLTEATQEVIALCKSQGWAGSEECRILSEISANYIRTGGNMPWDQFLASEAARIGAEELLMQWFPPNSRERETLRHQWQIRYIDTPVDQTVVIQKSIDPKAILLGAAGIAFLFVANA